MTDRHMIMLNLTGDVSITWDENQDAVMRTYIQKKMDAGYVFFRLEKRLLGKKMVKITDINQIGHNRKVWLDDDELQNVIGEGKVKIIKHPDADRSEYVLGVGHIKTAAEVAQSTSIAVRPIQGG